MDALILKALSAKQRYRSLVHAVPTGMLDPTTSAMLQWYAVYFEAFPQSDFVNPEELKSLVRLRSGSASPEQLALTMHICERLHEPVDENSLNSILGQLHELDLAGRVGALLAQYNAGEEVQLAYELNKLSTQTVRTMSQSAPTEYIDTPIDQILSEISEDKGIKFRRIALLREHISGLLGGASIAVGARPDKGKTSFIAHTITDFAPQLAEFFGPGRPILWMNNEGSGKRIIPRVYQAALGMDLTEIIHLSNQGKLVPAYAKAVGGDPTIIRVKDMHGASLAQAEQVIEAIRPAVVVWDMLANFRIPSGGGNKADDVERAWQEVREMAVRHDMISMATVQISNEGGNNLYPPYSALKDSKTGIQGATDIILMMGSLDNPDAQSIRGLSTPKNKFAVPGKQSYACGEVYLDASRCKFDDGAGATPA